MKILSIESSCDDSSLALTDFDNAKLLWHTKISQEHNHRIYGGVVPEIASRLFAKDLPLLLDEFNQCYSFDDIGCISVTNEPGLSTSLLEGVMMAKSLALCHHIPLVGINHLKGHIYSLFINESSEIFPICVLLVSGGHTMIVECYNYNDMRIIAQTLDDSFGECYDKVAKMLGLGYPGGSTIDNIAQTALDEFVTPISFPIPLQQQNTLNFSFSGLKNAFRLKLQEKSSLLEFIQKAMIQQDSIKQDLAQSLQQYETKILDSHLSELESLLSDIKNHADTKALCLGLQMSATEHLTQKCKKYLKKASNIKHFAIVGGASANSLLRHKIQNLCQEFKKTLLVTKLQYCSDNAAMIGRATLAKLNETPNWDTMKIFHPFYLDISPRNTEILPL